MHTHFHALGGRATAECGTKGLRIPLNSASPTTIALVVVLYTRRPSSCNHRLPIITSATSAVYLTFKPNVQTSSSINCLATSPFDSTTSNYHNLRNICSTTFSNHFFFVYVTCTAYLSINYHEWSCVSLHDTTQTPQAKLDDTKLVSYEYRTPPA